MFDYFLDSLISYLVYKYFLLFLSLLSQRTKENKLFTRNWNQNILPLLLLKK